MPEDLGNLGDLFLGNTSIEYPIIKKLKNVLGADKVRYLPKSQKDILIKLHSIATDKLKKLELLIGHQAVYNLKRHDIWPFFIRQIDMTPEIDSDKIPNNAFLKPINVESVLKNDSIKPLSMKDAMASIQKNNLELRTSSENAKVKIERLIELFAQLFQ